MHYRHPLYGRWYMMKQRCFNPANDAFVDYGGRGITVCDRWLDFKNFVEDMGLPPEGSTLGRVDNNGPYCKENCRWESYAEQNVNYRKNHVIEYNGVKKVLSAWCKDLGLNYMRVYQRIYRYGWSVDRAFESN